MTTRHRHDDWTPGAIASVFGMILAAPFMGYCTVHGIRHDARIQACYDQPTEAQQIKCMEEL